MNDMSSVPARLAIEWPAPLINNPADALEAAGGHTERLRALLGAVVTGIHEDVLPDALSGDGSIVAAYLQLRIVDEKLAELEKLLSAIHEAMPEPRSSNGKDVALVRRQDWQTALEAYHAAEAAPGQTDADFERASEAFQTLIATPAPDLRALHAKMTLIEQQTSWSLIGAVPALLEDVERFAQAEAPALNMEG